MKPLLTLLLSSVVFVSLVLISPSSSETALAIYCPVTPDRPIRVNDGFLSLTDPSKISSYTLSTSGCLTDARAVIPKFNIPLYPEMKSIYYSQPKADPAQITKETKVGNWEFKDLPLGSTSYYLYNITGDLSINYDVSGSKVVVVFVDGNLTIDPFNSANKFTYSSADSNGGVIFVVSGDIRINKNTTEVNAILVSFGQFCSAWDSASSTCQTGVITAPLLVNGSIIALTDTKPPKFGRSLAGSGTTTPAERIVFQPKYFAILKEIFSRDLTIWQEIH